MKTELTDKGWKEITVKEIVITSISERKEFCSIEEWLLFNKRQPKIGRKRKTCNCCKTNWEKLKGAVNLVFTDKGNKAICDNCLNTLKKRLNK